MNFEDLKLGKTRNSVIIVCGDLYIIELTYKDTERLARALVNLTKDTLGDDRA